MEPLKDMFGREFKVGDIVIYTPCQNRISAATVVKITAKKLRLSYVGVPSDISWIKDPSMCVIVDGDHVDRYVTWRILTD